VAPTAVIRPLEPGDIPAAQAVGWAALREMSPAEALPVDEALQAQRGRARLRHLRATDPEGCWVADLDGETVGVAVALVREDVWGLSLLAVKPGLQGRGLGGRLLQPALRYADGRRGGIILSSTDPRALRRYFRAGFRLRPSIAAGGEINRSRLPAGLRARPGDVEADRELLDAASRRVRGASHGPDYAVLLEAGTELLVLDGAGFAFHREGSPILLAADEPAAATDLLWSCLAAGPAGAPVHIDYVTEDNDWAIAAALDAGLALGTDGPVFVRGETGTFAPYLPSGAFL
jgi:GNAT superfamily N-acetyltransferase